MSFAVTAGDGIEEIVLAGSDLPPAEDGGPTLGFEWDGSEAPRSDVLWLARPGVGRAAGRVIGPAGGGLWRYAPWPAADVLFDLAPPTGDAAVVIGEGAAAEVSSMLETRGIAVTRASRLGVSELESASVVVFPGEPGGPLPGEVPAVLAAGRVLVTSPCLPAFGFRPGIDHCQRTGPEGLASLTESVLRHWEAFGAMRAHARRAAERHRASRVLRDLLVDIELGL